MLKLFAYYGGKYFMLKDIYKEITDYYLIKNHKLTTFVDVFGGSGSVLLNFPNDFGKINKIYNDIDSRLYNLMIGLQDDKKREEIKKKYEYALRSREYFNYLKSKQDLDGFEFLYLLANSFNGDASSFSINKTIYKNEFSHKFDNAMTNWKYMKNWIIENLDFRDLIKKYDSEITFFYLDPPYLTAGKTYKYPFTKQDFIDLKNTMSGVKGKWMMNESERDFDFIKSVFGKPKLVKKYRNNFLNRFSHLSYRKEGFWDNF